MKALFFMSLMALSFVATAQDFIVYFSEDGKSIMMDQNTVDDVLVHAESIDLENLVPSVNGALNLLLWIIKEDERSLVKAYSGSLIVDVFGATASVYKSKELLGEISWVVRFSNKEAATITSSYNSAISIVCHWAMRMFRGEQL